MTRAETLDSLVTALRRAQTGHDPDTPHTLIITAGPGTGKTHTLHELLRSAIGTVRIATAQELSWRQPFAVAADLLGAELATPIPSGFADDLYARVDHLCESGPVLLVVDDAHHADAASLELMLALSDATRDLPLTLLMARRSLPTRAIVSRLLTRTSVREFSLAPMNTAELTELTRELLRADPDPRLAELVATSQGNPMHAISLISSLRRSGRLHLTDGMATLATDDDLDNTELSATTAAVIAEHLALLDPAALDLTGKLAVWGDRATLADLAEIDRSVPAALVGPAQAAIDAGILATAADGSLGFTHDLYGDVSYERLAPPLRAVLHAAIAEIAASRGHRQRAAHHQLAAGTDDASTLNAVQLASDELDNAPAVAVDLLDTLTSARPGSRAAPGTYTSLATALARTGQLARATAVAADGLANTTDIDEFAQLTRIRLFSLIAQGDADGARSLIDDTVKLPVGEEVSIRLRDLRAYVDLLDAARALPTEPLLVVDDLATAVSLEGTVAEALRLFLTGSAVEGLRLALMASGQAGIDHADGLSSTSSADIWPALIEQYAHGPDAAANLLAGTTTLRAGRGAEWMRAYHEFTLGGIEYFRGHLDDAAAAFDTGLELAAAADMGWLSLAVGGRALIDVLRGEVTAATTRLDEWDGLSLPSQFGIPTTMHVRALLAESRRKMREAAATAAQVLQHASSLGLHGWLPAVAIDLARIGVRAQDRELLVALRAALARLPRPLAPIAVGAVAVADAMCATFLQVSGPESVLSAAQSAAAEYRDSGSAVMCMEVSEEAACAAAALGDKVTARELAVEALGLSQSMRAVIVAARLASRLRSLGLRLDPHIVRQKPRFGWEALTPTEVTVAELVATGLRGGEIGERLNISTRTVQTHVSHALTKLDLRTRVELATFVTGRAR